MNFTQFYINSYCVLEKMLIIGRYSGKILHNLISKGCTNGNYRHGRY